MPFGDAFGVRAVVRACIGLAVLTAIAIGGARAEVEAPGGVRDVLTAEVLRHGRQMGDEAVHNGWFMPVGASAPALHAFTGTLHLPETRMAGFDGGDRGDAWFPAVALTFISHDGYLIPVEPGIVGGTGSRSPWDIIVSPGRIWSEADDGGRSRASFPFVLAGGAWWNEAHNGLATFVFDDDGVSDVRFQIVQETAPYNTFDGFGRLEATYDPHDVAQAAAVLAAFKMDRAARLPVRPFADLESGFSLAAMRTFAGRYRDEPVSASGLVVDGVIYLRPCETRYGDFPYCEEMRHGVFSVTKSLGAMVAMLYLAEKHGDHVFDLRIRDYLEVTAHHDGWQDVTFADALNMATGIGEGSPNAGSAHYYAEVFPGWKTTLFLDSPSTSGKLRAAFAGLDYDWGPGEIFRYRNMDTFVLAAAMDSLVKRLEGPEANMWDNVMAEVLQPIGIPSIPISRTVEPDGGTGIPMMAAGLYPNVHDIAKITSLLHTKGRHDGQQLLSEAKLDEAFYRTPIRGLDVPGFDETYHMSLWYFWVRQGPCRVTVPHMSGWGGNIIEVLPNGLTAFFLSDDFVNEYRAVAEAAGEVRPLCS
ncbi:MAG: serine hydrolase domain-containing protein [Pseudomonadota bacterium]